MRLVAGGGGGLGLDNRLLTRGLGFGDRLLTSSRSLGFGNRLLMRVSIMGLRCINLAKNYSQQRRAGWLSGLGPGLVEQ